MPQFPNMAPKNLRQSGKTSSGTVFKPPLERNIHKSLAKWLAVQYPTVIFHTDYGAGLKLTPGQAAIQKSLQSSRAWPDLFIAEMSPAGYAGLFIEIKRDRKQVYLKGGALKGDQHIQEQAAMLQKLRDRGYYATFGCGLEDCINIINNYFK